MELTDGAKEELKRILDGKDLDQGQFLRLATPPSWSGEGDYGIVVGAEGHADQVVEYGGEKLLLIDPVVAERLKSAVFDFKESRFTLDVY